MVLVCLHGISCEIIVLSNQIPLIPPGNQTFEQLPFGLAHAPRNLPQITQRQANDIPDGEFRNDAHDN